MEIKDILTYLAALFLPLWLAGENLLAWWALWRQTTAGSEHGAGDGAATPAAADQAPKTFTQKAA